MLSNQLKKQFTSKLLDWHAHENFRTLPWKEERDPYKIWLSEIILQQTRAEQGLPYYLRFIDQYPTIIDLAEANDDHIFKLWEGLGYYRRARNLLASSKLLVKNYNSKLPNTIDEIKKLPGVGEYTANALLGLIHNQPTIAIDGNVKRVFARLLNKKKEEINYEKLILLNKNKLFNTNRNADFVEALMEFGALICKPKDPKCSICCLNKNCKYFKSSKKITI